MTKRIYVVFDRIAEESGPIFEAKNDAVALRQFRRMQQEHPVDWSEFDLYCLGEVDHVINSITAFATGEKVEATMSIVEMEADEA